MALGQQVIVQRQLVSPRGMPRDPAQFARYRTQMRERPEDIWQSLFDRVNYPAAGVAGDVSFFAVPLGGAATLIQAGAAVSKTKSFRDTNLPNQGVLPAKAFQIHGFSLHYVPLQQAVGAAATPSIFDDIQRLMNGGFFEIRLIDKPYLVLPLWKVPDPGAIRAMAATTATATTIISAAGPGTGSPRDIYWITPPLTIDPYQNFFLRTSFDGAPAIGQTNDMAFALEGFTRRPGQ
jgi:hypothetical protein